jgi:hypothetical protein
MVRFFNFLKIKWILSYKEKIFFKIKANKYKASKLLINMKIKLNLKKLDKKKKKKYLIWK